MSAVQPKITAVILNLLEAACLYDCLRSVDKAGYPPLDVIVVRNGPADEDFASRVRSASSRVSDVIFTGANLGFAAGNNIGIRAALDKGAQYVLLLNDDTVMPPQLPGRLTEEAQRARNAGMLGPEVVSGGNGETISFRGAEFDAENCSFTFPHAEERASAAPQGEPFRSDFITGCALLVKREVIEKIGLLDERFFLYWEDSDWCFRARAAGYDCLVVPSVRIWHLVAASSGGAASPSKIYHKTLSHLLFAGIYAPGAKRKLLAGFLRDIAWLLLKSADEKRWLKARMYAKAIGAHYFCSRRRGD